MLLIQIDILNLLLKHMLQLTFVQRRRRLNIVSFLCLFLVACLAAGGLFMCGVRASERVAWRQKLSSSRRFQIYLILSVLCALLSLVTAFFWLLCMYAITDSLDFALLGVILWNALWQALALMVWTIFACLARIWELDTCSLTQNWIDSGSAARTLMIS